MKTLENSIQPYVKQFVYKNIKTLTSKKTERIIKILMNCVITVKAYAKINFGLKVLPKRNDGFHNIESIFQTIDLFDELIVTPTSEKGCIVQCDSMQLPENNTLISAYNAFCDVTGVDSIGLSVKLIKGIPSGGGLGGGSSDAAAIIRVLQTITEMKLTDEQLDYIASKTGSDVFFFMHCDENGKGCAVVTGRGEYVRSIKPRTDIFLLLIFPKVSSSTKEAYCLVDKAFEEGKNIEGPTISELERIYYNPLESWTFKNTFTPVIAEAYEEIKTAIMDIKEAGCCFAEMSGSGSTVYGAFTLRQQAQTVSNLLGNAWNCKLVQTV